MSCFFTQPLKKVKVEIVDNKLLEKLDGDNRPSQEEDVDAETPPAVME